MSPSNDAAPEHPVGPLLAFVLAPLITFLLVAAATTLLPTTAPLTYYQTVAFSLIRDGLSSAVLAAGRLLGVVVGGAQLSFGAWRAHTVSVEAVPASHFLVGR